MLKRKLLFGAVALIAFSMLVFRADAVSFSVTVEPATLWPGETVEVTVSMDPQGVGVILLWKPLLYNLDDINLTEPIVNWVQFLEVFSWYPDVMIFTADILVFDGYGTNSTYPTTWNETIHFDPYYFDLCNPWNETYPIGTTPEIVLWNEDWQDYQENFYGEYAGPNTNILGKYFVAVFATDAEWMFSLLENICSQNWPVVFELICDPPWVGVFITTITVIPELFPGTIAAVATPLLAFVALRTFLRRDRRSN